MDYSVVIATLNRPEKLKLALQSLVEQQQRPVETIIVDASENNASEMVVEKFSGQLPLKYLRAVEKSAACQRNQGGEKVKTPLIGFMDDDAVVLPNTWSTLVAVFDQDAEGKVGGVAARMEGLQRSRPGKLVSIYYRLQAGYAHPTYGGKLFGPAINCLPEYTEGELIPADWLNSGCTLYWTELFLREKFPPFPGYSFMEDVHLSARIAKTHQIYFHSSARFLHDLSPSDFRGDRAKMARNRLKNQRFVAREVMGLKGITLEVKLLLHRLFITLVLLRSRPSGYKREIWGVWT